MSLGYAASSNGPHLSTSFRPGASVTGVRTGHRLLWVSQAETDVCIPPTHARLSLAAVFTGIHEKQQPSFASPLSLRLSPTRQ